MCQVSSVKKDFHFKFNSIPTPAHSTVFSLPNCLCVEDLLYNVGGPEAIEQNNLMTVLGKLEKWCLNVYRCICLYTAIILTPPKYGCR